MKTIYIAGPFRAKTAWLVEENIRNAERVGLLVASMGAIPIIPHSMYRFFNGERTDDFWLEATLELLRRCDALALIPNWQDSSGSRGELQEAKKINIPVFDLKQEGLAPLAGFIDETNVAKTLALGRMEQQLTFEMLTRGQNR